MQIKQEQKITQKIILTPQMRQFLYLLQLPSIELKEYLDLQVEENPVLEYVDAENGIESIEENEKIKQLLKIEEAKESLPFASLQYDSEEEKKKKYQENLLTQTITLHEYLLRQLRYYRLSEKEYCIGEYIIANIDENGYLKESIEEIKKEVNKNYPTITEEEITRILKLIQTFDPPGVGARNLKEALFIQLKAKKIDNPLVYRLIDEYLPLLAKRRLKEVAKRLKTSLKKVEKAFKIISSLNPKPGKEISSKNDIQTIIPDIIVEKIDNHFEIILNTKNIPNLRINPHYKTLLNSSETPSETKKYLRKKIKQAMELIKALIEREKMIKEITKHIIEIQKDFFEEGDPSLLKPLTLKELAKKLGKNESTISRVVNKKFIQTPFGIFKLDYFFISHLETKEGEKISTQKIKSLILELIAQENNSSPLKDHEIMRILKRFGIRISRRTVAKYRKELKIPSYSQRKAK